MKKELKRIAKLYLDGKLTGDTDEKERNGYWDLAGELADKLATKSWQYETLQTWFYQALRQTFVLGVDYDEFIDGFKYEK